MTEAAADSPEPTSIDIKAAHVFREWKYEAPLMGCRFDPTGRYVFAASMDTTIQRWDLQDVQLGKRGLQPIDKRQSGLGPRRVAGTLGKVNKNGGRKRSGQRLEEVRYQAGQVGETVDEDRR